MCIETLHITRQVLYIQPLEVHFHLTRAEYAVAKTKTDDKEPNMMDMVGTR